MKKDNPLVSVIIPTFNRPDLLKRSIESVLQQTWPDFEILVINDGGADVSNILKIPGQEKIRYFNLPENKGRGHARNFAINNSSGKYLAYLDDDDLFYPGHLEKLVNFLENNRQYKAVYAGAMLTKLEIVNGAYVETGKTPFLTEKFDYDSLLVIGNIALLSVIHHKSCIEATGLFDETLSCNEDWDFWIRLGKKFGFAVVNEITCEFFYRAGKDLTDFYKTRKIIYERYKSENRPYEVELERAKRLKEQITGPDYYFSQGRALFKEGKFPEAINFFGLFLKTDPPEKSEAFFLIAESLTKLGDRKTAAVYYERAREQNNKG
jgi:glycosyltransferase involved in cell wall biosynthesis